MRRRIEFAGSSNRCFGCGHGNPAGLQLSFVETDLGVEVEYTAPAHLQGAPGIIHGGIQATLLDETLCMTAYAKLGMSVVTGELTIRYLRPVPTEIPIVARGRIVEPRDRGAIIEAELYLPGSDEPLTRARGRFFAQPPPEQAVRETQR